MSTKSVASLLLVTAVAAAIPGASRVTVSKHRRESQFDRLLQRHDRKGELRASVLGMDAPTFRSLQRHHSFEEIVQQKGFANMRAFRVALLGKLKNELRGRGWTERKIRQFMIARSSRMGS